MPLKFRTKRFGCLADWGNRRTGRLSGEAETAFRFIPRLSALSPIPAAAILPVFHAPGGWATGRRAGAKTAAAEGARALAASARKLFSRVTFHPSQPEDEPEPAASEPGNRLDGENEGDEAGLGTALGPQPSDLDGVSEDMATLVIDKPALGVGLGAEFGSGSASWPERGSGSRTELDPAGDAAIMLRVAAGDEAGFNFLVGKYHRAIIHFLYRMVHNQAVAEELAQEVFLRVYRARTSYRAEARFTTWLYRIATNLAVNHARDTRHERAAQTIYLDAPDEETGATPDLPGDELSAEERMVRDERMAAIRAHVMELPERQRTAVLMHKYQGMDYRQIGEVLKLSESATKSLLFRAYQTLRGKLKDFV